MDEVLAVCHSTFHSAGATGVLRVEYKYVSATVELTVMRVFAKPVVFR